MAKQRKRKPKTATLKAPPKRFVVAPIFSAVVLGRRLNEIAKRVETGRVPWRQQTGRRPLILDPKIRQQIVSSIRLGAYLWVAAAAAGLTERTLMYWMAKGREGIEPYVQFFHDVEGAQGYARLTAEMRVHADDPKFWLRVGPGRERPGRPGWTEEAYRVEVTGPEGGPIEHEVEHKLSDDELIEVARLAVSTGIVDVTEAPTEAAGKVRPPHADS